MESVPQESVVAYSQDWFAAGTQGNSITLASQAFLPHPSCPCITAQPCWWLHDITLARSHPSTAWETLTTQKQQTAIWKPRVVQVHTQQGNLLQVWRSHRALSSGMCDCLTAVIASRACLQLSRGCISQIQPVRVTGSRKEQISNTLLGPKSYAKPLKGSDARTGVIWWDGWFCSLQTRLR